MTPKDQAARELLDRWLSESSLLELVFVGIAEPVGRHTSLRLDGFIKEVQASPVYQKAAIIVIWDSSGGWYDHVPPPQTDPGQGLGMRVPMLVISPFAKKNYISHVQMDDVSILRFIQQTFGLPPLNARNSQSNDLSDMFSF